MSVNRSAVVRRFYFPLDRCFQSVLKSFFMAYITDDEKAPPLAKFDRSWFIGTYVTRELKNLLKTEARAQKRTVAQQLIWILEERYNDTKANT